MKKLKGELYLFTTALIWGLAIFVQTTVTDSLGPLTFNGFRYLTGALSLLPLLKFKRTNINSKKCIILGIANGLCLFLACNFQQLAIVYNANLAKVGFISSLYIIIVPIMAYLLFKNKVGKNIILALIIAILGLYLLCGAILSFEFTDILLMACAFFYAMQMVLIGGYANDVNSVQLSLVQYITCGVVSMISGILFEDINFSGILASTIAILYTGIMSTGVASTLQIIGQRYTSSTIASLILSLEAVVSTLAGWLFLRQSLSFNELLGCALMFIAAIIAQVRIEDKNI